MNNHRDFVGYIEKTADESEPLRSFVAIQGAPQDIELLQQWSMAFSVSADAGTVTGEVSLDGRYSKASIWRFDPAAERYVMKIYEDRDLEMQSFMGLNSAGDGLVIASPDRISYVPYFAERVHSSSPIKWTRLSSMVPPEFGVESGCSHHAFLDDRSSRRQIVGCSEAKSDGHEHAWVLQF